MSDEAVRKELTVGMVERIIRLRFKKHGDDARLDNILAQFRSAAIQECAADAARIAEYHHQNHCDNNDTTYRNCGSAIGGGHQTDTD